MNANRKLIDNYYQIKYPVGGGGVSMLYDLLSNYNDKGVIPMHMPGHKRNTAMLGNALPYGIDITEIEGFDNLHDPHGVLKVSADIAAQLYGCRRAFSLINGSTGGILAGVRCATRYGDTVIMARNCHKSVYNAIDICGLRPVYIMPEIDQSTGICGSIHPEQVKMAADLHPEAKLIIITSPTYEGVVSDVSAICHIAHEKNVPVLVDAAHGAHFGFSEAFPPSPIACGADIVITSLHKTLPALTQCALALVNGSLIDDNRLAAELAVFQTTSPSYVLLSSIDYCLRLLSRDKEALFNTYAENIKAFDKSISRIEKLKILCHGPDSFKKHESFFDFDPGKIIISTRHTNLIGIDLANQLRSKYRIELEMAYTDYAVAMTSICDGWDAFELLIGALLDINRDAQNVLCNDKRICSPALPLQKYTAAETAYFKGRHIPLSDAAGKLSLEYIWAYPPGIPYIVPGEKMDDTMIHFIRQISDSGIALKSTTGQLPSSVYCAELTSTCL